MRITSDGVVNGNGRNVVRNLLNLFRYDSDKLTEGDERYSAFELHDGKYFLCRHGDGSVYDFVSSHPDVDSLKQYLRENGMSDIRFKKLFMLAVLLSAMPHLVPMYKQQMMIV